MSGKDKREARNWVNEEIAIFLKILVDDEFNFAGCFKRHALKRSANQEVFQEIYQ